MTLPVAILVGGFATRLLPMTKTMPKALIDVAGKPFIDWQLDYLIYQGIKRVILCVGHQGVKIQAYLGSGARYGLELQYSFDGPSPLGTGGAIKRALPLLGDAFFVLYGDSYVSVSLRDLEHQFNQQEQPGLMTVYKNTNPREASNVRFEKDRLLAYNKHAPSHDMNHIDYGLSLLSATLFHDYATDGPFDLADFYHSHSAQGALFGYEVFSRFYEIGTPEGWQETSHFLSQKSHQYDLHRTTSA